MAEIILRDLAFRRGIAPSLVIDSAGTHVIHPNLPPVPQTCGILGKYGLPCQGASRQLEYDDLNNFDYVLAMDARNYNFIKRYSRGTKAEVHLLLEYANQQHRTSIQTIEDPYPDGDYELAFRLIALGCDSLLTHLHARLNLTPNQTEGDSHPLS